MTARFIIAGTDTGVGKTVFSAALVDAIGGAYWKPVQAGLDGETDTEAVRRLANLPESRIFPEAYRLRTPASPHLAARYEGVEIKPPHPCPLPRKRLGVFDTPSWRASSATGRGGNSVPPSHERESNSVPSPQRGEGQGEGGLGPNVIHQTRVPLIIEASGGLLVPFSDHTLQIDIFRSWGFPVVLCARTSLGTINHTLLSIEALRSRNMPLLGVAFIGEAKPDVEETIVSFGKTRRLGRLAWIDPLSHAALRDAFAASFDKADFQGNSDAR